MVKEKHLEVEDLDSLNKRMSIKMRDIFSLLIFSHAADLTPPLFGS